MIFQNQQANILRVNGALADNFANRPASQGTYYIFYSLDTQEIWYDDVSGWILLGSGGAPPPPPSVNIYNSDGTLTGNRTLSGANNDLTFADLNVFKTSIGGNDIGLKLDFANGEYIFGDYTSISNFYIRCDSSNGVTIGDEFNYISGTTLKVQDNNQIIKTSNQGNDIGLKLDFANRVYELGQITGSNRTFLFVDDVTRQIRSSGNGINKGLTLNFNTDKYYLGDTGISGKIYLEVDNSLGFLSTYSIGGTNGILLDLISRTYSFGSIVGGNSTTLTIADSTPYPIRITGINVTSGSSSGSSGQHLKIQINGIDYKIKLENP